MPLPLTKQEALARGWNEVDIVFITGDAYIDHPSFATGILARVLEANGFRVGIVSQPNWKNADAWKTFGKPRLFFAISAGNMDSMINHYTANKKVRNDDAYSPGGKIGLRPDRATLVYCQRAREAYPGTLVVAGGVEASLRRLAHYDYWSDTVKKSILLDSKADLVAYGMGERLILEIAQKVSQGATREDLRKLRSVAYALGESEVKKMEGAYPDYFGKGTLEIPSFEDITSSKEKFAKATRWIHLNTNPFNAKTLYQRHGNQMVVATPPDLPLSTDEMDKVYDLPFSRQPHPSYHEKIPAYEMIKDSITIMRGCFGGCTFCSITAHQGRIIQSRSQKSILKEVENLAASKSFSGVISDIGGPTANMYQMRCTRPDVEAKCTRLSCVDPTICKLLGTDHGPLTELMKKIRNTKGIRKVFVASGVRMDLAQRDEKYVEDLAEHHVGGLLKVAPEHVNERTLKLMKKPSSENFKKFEEVFVRASKKVGKPKQYLVPYFIASHPGSDLHAMIELAQFLKKNDYRPDQVQDFIPAPFDIATCMYYTGIDPMTQKPVYVDKYLKNRKLQRALLQFFKPENYFQVREALEQAGREDLIGDRCDALISSRAPWQAVEARRQQRESSFGRFVHQIPKVKNAGYRPDRKTKARRERAWVDPR